MVQRCMSGTVWRGDVSRMSDLRSRGPGFESRPGTREETLGKFLTPMCLCHQAVYAGTGLRAVMPCGWGVKAGMVPYVGGR